MHHLYVWFLFLLAKMLNVPDALHQHSLNLKEIKKHTRERLTRKKKQRKLAKREQLYSRCLESRATDECTLQPLSRARTHLLLHYSTIRMRTQKRTQTFIKVRWS